MNREHHKTQGIEYSSALFWLEFRFGLQGLLVLIAQLWALYFAQECKRVDNTEEMVRRRWMSVEGC